jgi:peptidoglycan/LPS O-acetylase OafA/YrhL
LKYIKQLDTLRAVAVILVIISHWIPAGALINKTPNGIIGVDIFFVLSGFLISKILLDNRIKAEATGVSKSTVIKNFYIRRCLRIFPIYYLVIFLLLIFSTATGTNIKGEFLYFFTYTSNIYFFKIKTWDGIISHLWSLAVEEQFYILFPWLLLFINKKYLLHVITGFILIGVISQFLMSNIKMSEILTFCCFDAFGLGALLAWQVSYRPQKIKKFYAITSIVAVIALALFITGIIQKQWNYVPLKTIISVIALWIITYIVSNSASNTIRLKFFWNSSILIFLGRISYGIYLYHNIIPHMLNLNIINKYVNPLLPDFLYKTYWPQLYFVENVILLILIAWLSYTFIEKRFLNLKKYFSYQDKNSTEKMAAHLVSQ